METEFRVAFEEPDFQSETEFRPHTRESAGESHPDPTHSPILGVKLAEKLKEVGVDEMSSTTEPNTKHPNANASLFDRLKK